jgi:hypothetical protein
MTGINVLALMPLTAQTIADMNMAKRKPNFRPSGYGMLSSGSGNVNRG